MQKYIPSLLECIRPAEEEAAADQRRATDFARMPCSNSRSTRWLPTNPAPPVTTTRRGGGRNPAGTPERAAKEKNGPGRQRRVGGG